VSDLSDLGAKLDANHIEHTTVLTNVPVIVIPVPVRPRPRLTGRGAPKHAAGNFVLSDGDGGLALLFYPDTTWEQGGYDDDAMASAATGLETYQVISALHDFGKPLNEIMEFDHVIEVKPNGLIVDVNGIYAPDLRNGELETSADEWDLMDGYSGQSGYSGPIMHNSEFIGGGMERKIRETPGIYVALVCDWDPDEDMGQSEDDDTAEGWAVARMEVQQ
jgi:hypothetical protein